MQETVTLDGYDRRILQALQEDARLTNQDLGARVHLSASQCSRRRQRLEEAGVVRRYRAELEPAALGLGVVAFVNVQLSTHSRDNARRFRLLVEGLAEVQEAHALTGDMDYLIKMVVADLKALQRVINDVLLPHESVAHVRSSIVLDTLKDDPTLPVGP